MERMGGDWRGRDWKGLERFPNTITLDTGWDGNGAERTGKDRMGGEWIGVDWFLPWLFHLTQEKDHASNVRRWKEETKRG